MAITAMYQLVLLLFQVPLLLAICSFPDFLTSVPYWEGQIQNEHYRPDQLLTFRGDTMRMNIYYPNYRVKFLKCHSVQKLNSFIVVDTSEGQPTYKCIKFFKRSPYVMQTAESRISKTDDPIICQNSNLELSAWPFLYPVLRDVYVDCPRIGGYDMYMYAYEDKALVKKCDPFIPARLESECMPGEGMVFNFQHHDCVDGWSMSIHQEALCLGSWTEDNFTFVVLHDKADYFAKIWMLRIPSTPSAYFRAYLIKDIVADTNATIAKEKQDKYIAINMRRRIMKSLCEDDSPKCNNSCASDVMKNYCFKSCKVCEDSKVPNCTMRQDSLGLWYDSSISGTKYINITNDTLLIDKMPPLKCVDLSHGSKGSNSGYRSLVSIFENGCRPRFSCGSFDRHSDSILHFRLSQPVSPIATSKLLTGDVCFPLNFRPDTTPLKNFYRSNNKKSIIYVPPPPKNRNLVTCGLQGPLEVNVTYASGVNCTARILNCNITNSIVWQTDLSCAEPGPRRVVFDCLASYSDLTKAFIITQRHDDHKELHCWVYNDDVYKNSPNKLFIMRPADCNLHSMNDIQYSGLEIYVSKISFQYAKFSSTKECAGITGITPSSPAAVSTSTISNTETTTSSEAKSTSSPEATSPTGDVESYINDAYPPGGQEVLLTDPPITLSFTDRVTATTHGVTPGAKSTTADSTEVEVTTTGYSIQQQTTENTELGISSSTMLSSDEQTSAEVVTTSLPKVGMSTEAEEVTTTSLPEVRLSTDSEIVDSETTKTQTTGAEVEITEATPTPTSGIMSSTILVAGIEDDTIPEQSTKIAKMTEETTVTASMVTETTQASTQLNVAENTETDADLTTIGDATTMAMHSTSVEDIEPTDEGITTTGMVMTESATQSATTENNQATELVTEDGTTIQEKNVKPHSSIESPHQERPTTAILELRSSPKSTDSTDESTTKSIKSKSESTTESVDISTGIESTQLNLQITETVTEENDQTTEQLSTIEVTSEKPITKVTQRSPSNSSAQLSEALPDVHTLNTTVINVTSDRIVTGTQPNKFRVARDNTIGRAGNSVQAKSITSASEKMSSFKGIIILTLLSFSLHCYSAIL